MHENSNGDPNTTWTVIVGMVGAILVFVIIVALQALFYQVQESQYYEKVVLPAPVELSRLSAQQQERLHSYRWIDKQRGILAIPIDRAMELVVREAANSISYRSTENRSTP